MPKYMSDLRIDLVKCLNQCCTCTGHGVFSLHIHRHSQGVLRVVLEAAPSEIYEGKDEELRVASDETSQFRSLDQVGAYLIGILVRIRREADGNGTVDVRCRQANGKTRIVIKYTCHHREIILRDKEIRANAEPAEVAG